jgi:hypothetical protein
LPHDLDIYTNEEKAAVSNLTDPSISSLNFVSQILEVLASQVSPSTLSASLINTFLQQAQQTLETPRDNDIRLLSLGSVSSISSACSFIRTFTDAAQQARLREGLWCWALGIPKIPCGKGDHGVQAKALKEMLHLPMRPEEDAHLLRFLSHPPRNLPSPTLSLLHDLVTLRMVHQGQYAESLQLDKELAGTAGGQNAGQRRREMVGEFISILPEVQRRVLLVDGEAVASRRNEERRNLVNGFGNGDNEIEMTDALGDNGSIPPGDGNTLSATALFDLAQEIPLPGSPLVQRASPFAGPPRFASPSNANRPGLGSRVLSGSPFTLPRLASNGSPVPKAPKRIINDDDNPVPIGLRRRVRSRKSEASVPPATEVEPPLEDVVPPDDGVETQKEQSPAAEPPTPVPRRSGRRASGSRPAKQSTPEASSPPSPPSKNTRSRQSSAQPPQLTYTMPGSFDNEPLFTDSIPEDSEVGGDRPRLPSTMPESRSRSRRSASRAVLDDPPAPPAKRTKRAGSQATEEGAPVRRSARKGTAQPSERGSPTPSVAASVASGAGGRRSKRVEGSQTSRMSTRAKKA